MKKEWVLTGVGVGVTGLGFFLALYGFDWLLNDGLHKELSMDQTSDNFKTFLVTPFPLIYKIYFFEVTNPDQVQKGALPILKEKGPYVYSEYRKRVGIVYSKDGDWVKYYIRKTYFFNSELSGCHSDYDEVTVLNVALAAMAAQISVTTPEIIPVVNEAVPLIFPDSKTVFSKVRVKDLLFDGIVLNCSSPDSALICNGIKATGTAAMWPHENKKDLLFAIFHHMNDTDEGPFVMGLGAINSTRGFLQAFQEFEGKVNVWKTDECNAIQGTDGTYFPPFNKMNRTKMFVFSSDLCRSIYLTYEKDVDFNGVNAYRYVNTEAVFDATPENACYCVEETNEDFEKDTVCPPKGTLNLLPCMKSATFFSNPHFYLADKKLLKFARGLKPYKKKHQTIVEIEPITGAPVKGAKRAQINIPLKKLDELDLFQTLPTGLFPIIWFEELAEMSGDLLQKLQMLYTALKVISILKWVIILIGLGLVGSGIYIYMRNEKMACFSPDSRVDDAGDGAGWTEDGKRISMSENNFNAELTPIRDKTVNVKIPRNYDDRFIM